jgi:hypothetical protein
VNFEKLVGWRIPRAEADDLDAGAGAGDSGEAAGGGGTRSVITDPDKGGGGAPADWPEDWRSKLGGDDEKDLSRLKRFASPRDVWKTYRNIEGRVSSGELKAGLPKDADEETIAKWRSENGVPEKAEGYYDSLGDLNIGEDERSRADSFFQVAHKHNLSPEQARDIVAWSYEEQERQMEALYERDQKVLADSSDELRGEWGNEYRSNINLVSGFLDLAPTGVKDFLLNARGPDETPIMSHPDTVRWLHSMASTITGESNTIVPGNGMDQLATVESELNQIRDVMRTNRAKYDRDDKMQSRMRQLLDAQTKLQTRNQRA